MAAISSRPMVTSRKNVKYLTVAAGAPAMLGLSACGGGSGGATRAAASRPAAPATSTTTTAAPASTTTVPVATTTPTATAGTPLQDFLPAVRAALATLVGHTTVPPAGPTQLDTTAAVSATAGAGTSAQQGDTSLTPTAGGYVVGLYVCPQASYPVNDPRIANNCEGAATTLGGFAGQPEPSASAAVAALPSVVSPTGPGGGAITAACPSGSSTTVVDRQPVATCGTIAGTNGPATASWTEDEWTIVYSMGNGMTVPRRWGP